MKKKRSRKKKLHIERDTNETIIGDDAIMQFSFAIDSLVDDMLKNIKLHKIDNNNNLILDENNNIECNINLEIIKLITPNLLRQHNISINQIQEIREEIINYIKSLLSFNEEELEQGQLEQSTVNNKINKDTKSVSFAEKDVYISEPIKEPKLIKEDEIYIDTIVKNIFTNDTACQPERTVFDCSGCQNYVRPWTRYRSDCWPFQRYPREDLNDVGNSLNMRRKAEILKYNNNKINLSKKAQYSMLAQGKLRKKKSWATQTNTYTNHNSINLTRSGRISKSTPNGTIFVCNGTTNNCARSTASDVPGKPMQLCVNNKVPLVNYKVKRTYLSGVGKWPMLS